jgi:3-oxoacyl-[acyl-carrier-protein] synthase III
MMQASITGWGSCMPPAVLSNDDLSTFLDTSDEWIVTRTGMRERRISHVSATDLATLAARRALACAGVDGSDVELVI